MAPSPPAASPDSCVAGEAEFYLAVREEPEQASSDARCWAITCHKLVVYVQVIEAKGSLN